MSASLQRFFLADIGNYCYLASEADAERSRLRDLLRQAWAAAKGAIVSAEVAAAIDAVLKGE